MDIHVPDHIARDLVALSDEHAHLSLLMDLHRGLNDQERERWNEVRSQLAGIAWSLGLQSIGEALYLASQIAIEEAVEEAEQQLGLRGAA